MSSTESMATPALPTSPVTRGWSRVVAAVGGQVEGHARRPARRRPAPCGRRRSTPRRWRSRRTGGSSRAAPRTSWPAGRARRARSRAACRRRASPAMSAAVYSGLTVMPSGVTQFSASTSPPGADLAAALLQASRRGRCEFGVLSVMAGSIAQGWQLGYLVLAAQAWRRMQLYIIYNYSFKIDAAQPTIPAPCLHRLSPPPLRPRALAPAPSTRRWPNACASDLHARTEPGSWIDELKLAEELRHQPHAAARSAQGAGRRRPGDDEGAPRRLCDRDVAATTWPRSTTCSACWRATPPPWWPRRPRPNSWPNWRALHDRLENAAARQPARRLLRHQRALSHALLEIADNRWRDQMVADLRKVMKLNRHHSLLKPAAGRIAGRAPRHHGRPERARCRRGGQRMREHFKNGLEAAA